MPPKTSFPRHGKICLAWDFLSTGRNSTTLARYRRELTASIHGRFPSSVFDFFKTWILTHIMIVDRQYYAFEKLQSAGSGDKSRVRPSG